MRNRYVWSLLLLTGVSALSLAAGDPERGRNLAVACAACHGAEGMSPSSAFPILGGQHEAYLLQAMQAYRDKTRQNAIMTAAVVNHTDEQLADLAAWFASRGGLGAAHGPMAAAGLPAGIPGDSVGAVTAGAAATLSVSTAAAGLQCPAGGPNQDSDNDGLADAYDAAPGNAGEFVADSDGNSRFEICSIQQLQAILTLGTGNGKATTLDIATRMGRDYELARDIDAVALDSFLPIGNCGVENNCMVNFDKFGFAGSMDGNGFTVRNLTINQPQSGGVALFGVLARVGKIRNVSIENANVTGKGGTGTLVGANFGTVSNCKATGRVRSLNAVGGLVGGNAGTVSYSQAAVDVSGEMAVGGLVGDQNGVVLYGFSSSRVSGNVGVGGLVGLNTRGKIMNSYATGSATGKDNVGGLVGVNTDATLANSWASTRVTGTGRNAGGLVGFNSLSRLHNSYSRGEVAGVNAVGGIAGNNNGTVNRTYVGGSVSGQQHVGGLVGENAEGSVSSSYWAAENAKNIPAVGDAVDGPGAGPTGAVALPALGAEDSGWSTPDAASGPEMFYCDTDASGAVEDQEQAAENLIWDFGSVEEYPAVRCAIGGLPTQRN